MIDIARDTMTGIFVYFRSRDADILMKTFDFGMSILVLTARPRFA